MKKENEKIKKQKNTQNLWISQFLSWKFLPDFILWEIL